MTKLGALASATLLIASLTVAAEDEIQPADKLQLMMDFALEQPDQSTLFLYKKSLNKGAEVAQLRDQAANAGLNIEFREFYGDEITKGRLVEEFRDAGYQRVMFLGEGAEAKDFVKEAGSKDWGPDFLIPSDYAEELMDAEKLDFDGNILVSMNSSPEEGAGGVMDGEEFKVELEKMRVTAEAEKKKQQAAAYGGDSRLCETSRRTGSRLRKRTCYRSQEAKELRRQKDQEELQRRRRGSVQAPPGG